MNDELMKRQIGVYTFWHCTENRAIGKRWSLVFQSSEQRAVDVGHLSAPPSLRQIALL